MRRRRVIAVLLFSALLAGPVLVAAASDAAGRERERGHSATPEERGELRERGRSSAEAERVGREAGTSSREARREGLVDRSAAVLILQSWFDSSDRSGIHPDAGDPMDAGSAAGDSEVRSR